ncbi:hypothetical protein HDU76_002750 [Blyttiomyces sp. JEL0837]|nr:hypothetical protein HDU76_002750 [Blyttiomyces sp. JEL0837]
MQPPLAQPWRFLYSLAVFVSMISSYDKVSIYAQAAVSVPPSKYQSNISIASFLPYSVGDFYPTIMMEDYIMEMAINQINRDPTILPNTYVNLVRYNMWDPELSADWPIYTSAGSAMITAMDIAKSGVVAVVGEYFSRTAVFTAEVFSQFNNGFRKCFYCQSLRKAITILERQKSGSIGKLAETMFMEAGITILTKVVLTNSMFQNQDYEQAYKDLRDADASPNEVADLSVGFLGFNVPQTYVYTDSPLVHFYETLDNFNNENPLYASADALNYQANYVLNTYDCTNTILYGLHRFLNTTGYSAEILANGSAAHLLLPSLFADTGYPGLASNPVRLDSNGDLKVEKPVIFGTFNYSYVATPIQMVVDDSNAFLRLDASGTVFTETEYQPTFYGGSHIPPPDGPVLKELVIEWRSAYGIILAILSILGMLLCIIFLVLLLFLRTSRVIRFMSPLFTGIYTLGIFIANLSLLFFIGTVTSSSCALRMWIPYLAAPLTFGCSVIKNARVYAIFKLSSRGRIKKGVMRFFKDDFVLFVMGILVIIALILLSLWHSSFNHQDYLVTSDRSTRLHFCSEIPSDTSTATFKIASAMIAYISFLLASTGFLSYLTGSILDEGSFLSFSAMLGAVGFAVTLTTTLSAIPSETSIFIRNIVTWAVANLSLLLLYVPKLIETFADLNESTSGQFIGSLPTASLLGGTISTMVHEPVAVQASAHSPDQVEKGREVSHINLRGAYYKRQLKSLGRWTEWYNGGITVFRNGEKRWIVYDSKKESLSLQLDEDFRMHSIEGKFVYLKLTDFNGRKVRLWMEFNDSNFMNQFMDRLSKFKAGQNVTSLSLEQSSRASETSQGGRVAGS